MSSLLHIIESNPCSEIQSTALFDLLLNNNSSTRQLHQIFLTDDCHLQGS
ncbi:hypothetical protein PAHAL_8G053400 [Panicum hallii]|jgi:hypothetical protein|uniref:Uncharacterized protein n=1 Tax=Panicum hallii TaxID=206008 RepID=A0A2T8I7S3_9POAL|nr:hypothetical protein PAHAL_8G053400 [Panicum hallii]